MSDQGALLTYEGVKLPNKRFLSALNWVGSLLVGVGFVWVIWSLHTLLYPSQPYIGCNGDYASAYDATVRSSDADAYCAAKHAQLWITQMHWWYGVVIAIIGIAASVYALARRNELYGHVSQGVVVDKDTFGGSFFTDLGYKVLVEGNTKANALARSWHVITQGQYAKLEEGSTFSE